MYSRGTLAWVLISALPLQMSNFGCSKPAPPAETPAAVDRIVVSRPKPPNNFLHKTFQVNSYAKFEFVVPAHTIAPRMQGSFQSFVKGNSEDIVSNETANVDVLLLNEQEFDEFSHGRQGTATYTVDSSHSHMVECALASTLEESRKYYLVFRNPPGGPRTKFVKAEFTASFE